MIKLNEYFKDWAKHIIHGNACQSYAIDTIQDALYGEEWYKIPNCPCLFDIGSDDYDNSLELNFAYITEDEHIKDFIEKRLTQEICEFIINNGCSQFWMNFYPTEENSRDNKTYEIYYCKTISNKISLKIFTGAGQYTVKECIEIRANVSSPS